MTELHGSADNCLMVLTKTMGGGGGATVLSFKCELFVLDEQIISKELLLGHQLLYI